MTGIGVKVEMTQNGTRGRHAGDSSSLPPFFVFDKRYVDVNLGTAFAEGEPGTPLYVLGEANVELETKIAAATAENATQAEVVKNAKALYASKQRETRVVENEVKKEVAERLSAYDPGKYNSTRFNVNKAKALVQGERVPLTPEEAQQATTDLFLKASDIPGNAILPAVPDTSFVMTAVEEVLGHHVVSNSIAELQKDQALAEWVARGLGLHEERDDCGFCGNPVSHERRDALAAHFDRSYKALFGDLEVLSRAVEDLRANGKRFVSELKALAEVDGIRDVFVRFEVKLNHYYGEMREFLAAVEALWLERKGNPFADPLSLARPSEPVLDFDELSVAVAAYNATLSTRRAEVDSVRLAAEQSLLKHIAHKFGAKHDKAVQDQDSAKAAIGINEAARGVSERALAALLSERGDAKDGNALALRLSEDLCSYLGHRQLAVGYVHEGARKGFNFRRNGSTAHNLSEGERNAIALLHFLRSLQDLGNADRVSESIIVIDDPVSSLDHDSILSAFSFLRTTLRGANGRLQCAQTIVMTHNFSFFRQWKDALKSAMAKDRRKAAQAGVAVCELPEVRASVLEIRVRTQESNGVVTRTPVLRDFGMPTDIISSEYYYLFKMACEATHSGNEGLLPLTGNSTRRLLESFIRFKRPAQGNFTNAAEELGRESGLSDATTMRVVKALHGSSHRTELDIHTPAFRHGVVNDIRAALEFMKAVDSGHYAGLEAATGRTPAP